MPEELRKQGRIIAPEAVRMNKKDRQRYFQTFAYGQPVRSQT